MKPIILADNDRRELRPLNSRKPGALIKINGIPLLEHQIRSYLKAGVAEASITVVSGYHHNAVNRLLGGAHRATRLVKNADYRSNNVARSLPLALQTAEFDNEGLFISSGERVYDGRLIEELMRSSTNAVAGDTGRSGGEALLVQNGHIVRVDATVATEGATAAPADVWMLNDRAVSALKRVVAKRTDETG